MSTPNFIPGMKIKGIGRKSPIPFYKRVAREWYKSQKQQEKDKKEEERRKRANAPYMY